MVKRIINISIVFIILAFAVYMFINSSLFNIKNITVEGNNSISTKDIIKLSGLNKGYNVFLVNRDLVRKKIMNNLYVKDAVVKIKWPDNVIIDIKERNVVGAILFNGSYIQIDNEGTALNLLKSRDQYLPLLKGISFDRYNPGEKIKAKNNRQFEDALTILDWLKKAKMNDDVSEVDIKGSDIFLKAGVNINIKFGQVANVDYKLNFLKVILNNLAQKGYKEGNIDLSVNNPVFVP